MICSLIGEEARVKTRHDKRTEQSGYGKVGKLEGLHVLGAREDSVTRREKAIYQCP